MERHIYAIPTHRQCSESLDSLIREVTLSESGFCRDHEVDISVVVVDASEPEAAAKNRAALKTLSTKLNRFNTHHFTVESLDDMCNEALIALGARNREELSPLLTGNKYSYGMAANRTFLLAAFFGADYLHRRDSDTFLQHTEAKNVLSPLDLELKYLGKKLGPAGVVSPRASAPYLSDRIYMVGSGCVGDWSVDYEDLVEKNIESLYRLVQVSKPAMPYAEIKDYVDRKYVLGSREKYERDFLSLKFESFIDVGNSSVFEVYNQLPVSPAVQTSGVEYFFHEVLGALKMPKLYHNRKTIHRYDSGRYDKDKANSYHLTKAKARCLAPLYASLYKTIAAEPGEYFESGVFNADKISDCLMLLADKNIRREQEGILTLMANSYTETGITKYVEAAKYILSQKSAILEQSVRDVYNHALLTKEWPNLISWFRKAGRNG